MEKVLAVCNSTEIVDRDGEIWITGKRTASHGLVGTLVVFAAMLFLDGLMVATGFIPVAGVARVLLAALLLCAGAACAYGVVAVRRRLANPAPNDPGPALIIAGGRLLDSGRRDLAALADVRYRKVWQIASSARALALEWPGGKTVIARGNPFRDSIAGCVRVLKQRGIAKA